MVYHQFDNYTRGLLYYTHGLLHYTRGLIEYTSRINSSIRYLLIDIELSITDFEWCTTSLTIIPAV